jgi:hypothetical protein
MYFFTGMSEMKISDLVAVMQKQSESIPEYIQRFREVRNKCYSLSISHAELADLAFQGVLAPIKERFATCEFDSLSHLLHKVSAHEWCFQEQRGNWFKKPIVIPQSGNHPKKLGATTRSGNVLGLSGGLGNT